MKTPKPSPEKSKVDPIKEHLAALFEELQLAALWHRPSILMVVYRSRLVLMDAQISLEKRLRKQKTEVRRLEVNSENYDVALLLSQQPDLTKSVFFITGLANGGGALGLNAYRALNMRRELLVDHRIRVVFWLTEQEAATLMLNAIDFWAFRHRMIELLSDPSPMRITRLIRSLDWKSWNRPELLKEIPSGYLLRKELLEEIPGWMTAPAMRANLLHMLAGLQWAQCHYNEAQDLLKQGLAAIADDPLVSQQARFHSASGLISFSMGKPHLAIKSYLQSLELNPGSSQTWAELSGVYHNLQRTDEAFAAALKALELDEKNAGAIVTLGDLYCETGEFHQSISSYRHALTINPKDARAWVSLGDSYLSLTLPEDALTAFKKARRLDNKEPGVWIKLADTYQSLGFMNSAIRAFYKVTRLSPLDAAPWEKLGNLYVYINRYNNAKRAYRKALELDPANLAAQNSLSSLSAK